MKRIGYLLTEETVSLELCAKAITDAARHKHNRRFVKMVLADIPGYAEQLHNLILSGEYRPAKYKRCLITDQPSGKRRILHKPIFFPDQCVHHLLILLVQAPLMARLDAYCIASIPRRGTHYGYKAIKKWLREDAAGTKYCLKCDIRKCYEHIQPKVVVAAFAKFVKDERFLRLLARVAYSHASLPLGNYTSGWFENLVLADFDRKIRRLDGVTHYLRYVDDFVLFGPNKRKLAKAVPVVQETLAGLGLELKRNWQIFPSSQRGIDMLGYRFYPKFTLLRKRNFINLIKAIATYNKHPTAHLARGLISRLGHLKWFNSWNFKQMFCSNLKINKLKRIAYAGTSRKTA